jgi:hypothetical protein
MSWYCMQERETTSADNDEIEGEKELGTIGKINGNLANEVDGDGV